MTVRDRIVAACCGDLEQADLVESLLRRDVLGGHQPTGTDGTSTLLVPAENACERCTRPVDQDNFCFECGHTNPIKERP